MVGKLVIGSLSVIGVEFGLKNSTNWWRNWFV